MAARLSDKESQFARDYFVLFGSHMKAAAANHLPGAWAGQHCLPSWHLRLQAMGRQRGHMPCRWRKCCWLALHCIVFCRQHMAAYPPFSPPTAPLAAEAFSSLVRQAAAHPQKDMVPAPDLVGLPGVHRLAKRAHVLDGAVGGCSAGLHSSSRSRPCTEPRT